MTDRLERISGPELAVQSGLPARTIDRLIESGVIARPVRCALKIVTVLNDAGLPPVRGAVTFGPVIVRDGDYYGRTVNRAARLLGVALPEQVVVAADAAKELPDGEFLLADIGSVRLKGIDEDVRVASVAKAVIG